MNQVNTNCSEIKLVGITARTSNAAEMNPQTAQMGATMERFFKQNMPQSSPNSKEPHQIFAVYTDYESDKNGPCTYFLGQEVTSFQNVPEGFKTLTIPAQNYMKWTSNPGVMPQVVIGMWQKIWKKDITQLGGKRSYVADFEMYDSRSHDPHHSIVDVYIGVNE
jgi:predicted transcriptional regulator YdeE